MISREQLQSIEWAIKDEDGGSWCPACASPADIGHKCDCWLARALAASPADAGAPPALVALVQRWQKARLALRDAEDHIAYGMAEQVWEIHERALLAWSPAPAPVAPPEADNRRTCTCVGSCRGPEGLGARWKCALGKSAPPAVAGAGDAPGWPDANNPARWKPADVVGHVTVRDADGSLRHEPLTREVADALWKTSEEARLRRVASMPDERAAIAVLFSAWLRLKELGWKEAEYCPKDGTPFDAIEPGSTGVHHCVYEGQWPDGRWWTSDEHDMYPSRPILWRRRQGQ